LPVLLEADRGPWVNYHNIVGEVPKTGITGWLFGGTGDGVVSLASARLDDVRSQITVPADHVSVHRHPQSILEVRRILMQHIEDLRTFPNESGTNENGVQHASSQATPLNNYVGEVIEVNEEGSVLPSPTTATLPTVLTR
jgi:hypothetical protein